MNKKNSSDQPLRALTWNASTLNAARRDELSHFMSKNSIHIAFISEVKNKTQFRMNLVEFEQYAALDTWCFIRKSIQHTCLKRIETHKLELIIMQVGKIKILGCYIRSGDSSIELDNIIKIALEFDVDVIMGDLNANTTLPNKCGSALTQFLIDNNDWTSLNTTHNYTFKRNNVKCSELDYVLCHDRILQQVTKFSVIHDLDSDHYPLVTEFFGSDYRQITPNTPLLFAMNLHGKKFDGKFTDKLLRHWSNPPLLISPNGLELYLHITQCIESTLSPLISSRKKHRDKIHRPWIDVEVLEAIKTRNDARRRKLPEYQQLKVKVKKLILHKKRNSFHDRVAKVDYKMNIRSVWKFLHSASGSKTPLNIIGDRSLQANLVAINFQEITIPKFPVQGVFPPLELNSDSSANSVSLNNHINNSLIHLSEVQHAIQRTKTSSSPGPDGIPYGILKSFPLEMTECLLRLYNCWFCNGCIPQQVLVAFQVAIPKKESGSYRPISLMNTMVKVYENIIRHRVEPFISSLLPGYQLGFRCGAGAQNQLTRYVEHLQASRAQNLFSVSLFLDISKAFDKVDRRILLNELLECGISGRCLSAISNLLYDKQYRVLHGGILSDNYFTTQYGIPQGSAISPLLWNFYFRDVLKNVRLDSVHLQAFAFADDLVLVATHQNLENCYRLLTDAMEKIMPWSFQKGTEFNIGKLESLQICPRYTRTQSIGEFSVYCRDIDGHLTTVKKTTSYQYLGIIVDSTLSFQPWFKQLSMDISTRVLSLKRLTKTMKMDRRATEILHLGYIRGLLNYCSPIFLNNRRLMDKILTQERRGLSLTVAKLPRTTNRALYTETNLEYYETAVTRMSLRSFAKMLVHPTFLNAPILIHPKPLQIHKSFTAPLTNALIVWKALKLPLPGDEDFPAIFVVNPDTSLLEEPPDREFDRSIETSSKYWYISEYDSVDRPPLYSNDVRYSNPFATLHKLNELIELKFPRKKTNQRAYLHDWWKTRLLARIRMGVLPLRYCAFIQFPKINVSPKCRQCSIRRRDNVNELIAGPIFDEDETLDHIFGGYCRMIDYTELIPLYELLGIEFPHLFTSFQHALLSLYYRGSLELWNQVPGYLVRFAKTNNIFCYRF